MWLFTTIGFMSVVRKEDSKPNVLTVRFRTLDDANAFAESCPHKGEPRQVRSTPSNDYPFRVEVARGVFARWLAKHVNDELDYSNFKSEVARRQGYRRAHAYGDVWSVLRDDLDPRSKTRYISRPPPSLL